MGSTLTVADVGEHGLLKRLQRAVGSRGRGVTIGIGDDAALLHALGPQAVLTTDLLLEGIDFERRWATPADIGHKAAAVNLSDLAAMGARPRGLLLSLALVPSEPVAQVIRLVRAVATLGQRFGAPLVGGDLSRTSGPLVVCVTAIGEVEGKLALRRNRGRPGDLVLVSGETGSAAAGLEILRRGENKPRALVRRHLRPLPRIALGRALAASKMVRSAADVSDGLGRDALHVASPGCAVHLSTAALPITQELHSTAERLGLSPRSLALTGGEDFELVLAVAPANLDAVLALARRRHERLTVVGRITKGRGLHVDGHAAPANASTGYDHFSLTSHPQLPDNRRR